MILEGLKLTFLGMLVVFSFLTILVLTVKLSAFLLKNYSEREGSEMTSQNKKTASDLVAQDRKLVGIISAAVAAHMARDRNRSQ